MQKIILYMWVLVWVLQGGESVPGLVVAGNTDVHASERISSTLRQQLLADPTHREWLAQHRIGIAIQPLGPYHVVVVGPTISSEVQERLLVMLASFGMRPFGARVSADNFRQLVAPKHPKTDRTGSLQPHIDWIWLGVFLLALTGLITSIVQRKGLMRVKKGQKDVRSEQQRMDRELDGLQGEQRG